VNHDVRYRQLIRQIREIVRTTLPAGVTIIVVSKGDDELLMLNGGKQGWHFPQTRDGSYSGYHPADSTAAITHLEVLRAKGAQFLLIPSTTFWWLEYYKEFRWYLETHYRVVVRREDTCVIFALHEKVDIQMRNLSKLFEQDVANVVTEVSPNDLMYWSDPDLYFRWGQEALQFIKLAMLTAGREDTRSILDLPCGHGRVLRTLRAAYPEAKITACDLDQDAVDFCARVFDAIPVYSREQPNEIPIEGNFDLIWCGSLLTHLNAEHWSEFLKLFESLLVPGGILVFSTHGRWIAERLRGGYLDLGLTIPLTQDVLGDYDRDGFGYRNYPSQGNYGISLSSFSWVCSRLEKTSNFRLLNFTERGWYKHHDAIACLRV
jgi:SAM-dependent methyltransferase